MTTAREYLRVSVDRSGREKSQDQQHAENEAAAAAFGIDSLGRPYKDTGSASRHASKQRDGFARLLEDLDAGRFNADVLVLWESSRGSRKVSEWVRLVELCEEAEVKIAVTTHRRLYDPSNAHDRHNLYDDANDSEYESAKTSARGKRDAAALAVAGQPHGVAAYGYRRLYDPTTRKLIAQEPDPKERRVVVELFDRLAGGDSLVGIARDFKARGIASRGGISFAPQALRRLALTLAYAGKRTHREAVYDAAWPALVDDATFYAVQARLLDPARTTRRPGRAKWLLSNIAGCDVCGGLLTVKFPKGARRYQCHRNSCVTIDADELDRWAEREVLGLLTKPTTLKRLVPSGADPVALKAARGEVGRIKSEHRDLIRKVGAGQLSPAMAAGSEPMILDRLSVAESKVAELTRPVGLRGLIEPGAQVGAQWNSMPMSAKREVVRLLFVPGVVGVLSIARGRGESTQSRIRLDGKPLRGQNPS
jgi:DNA invertase Pin-like site-specific DNA recombinase